MTRMKMPAQRIPCLDGLRAVSILLVMLGHGWNTFASREHWLPSLAPVLINAGLGVMVFFVISGYLITSLLHAEWRRAGKIDMKNFYVRRVLRIFPAFYAYIAVVFVLAAAGVVLIAPNQLFSAATFLWNYRHLWNHINDDANWFLGHFWTLSLEEQFYLLWPVALFLCTPARAAWIAVVLIVLSPPLRILTYALWPAARGQIGLMLHTASDPLMFGCLAALWQDCPRFEAVWQRVEAAGCIVPMVAASFLILVSPFLQIAFRGAYQITVGMTLEAFSITVLMLWLVRHPHSSAGRFLQRRFVVHVGLLSYSLYIWQQLFLTTLNTTWTGRFPLNLLAAFLAAEASYHLLERPFLRLRHRPVPSLQSDALP